MGYSKHMANRSMLPLVCTACYAASTGDASARGLLSLALAADIALTVIIMLCVANRGTALEALLIGCLIAGLLAVRRYAMSRYYCPTCGSGALIPVRSARGEIIAGELEKLEESRPKNTPLVARPTAERPAEISSTIPSATEASTAVVTANAPAVPTAAPVPERPTRTLTIDQEKFLADKVAKEDAERFKGTP